MYILAILSLKVKKTIRFSVSCVFVNHLKPVYRDCCKLPIKWDFIYLLFKSAGVKSNVFGIFPVLLSLSVFADGNIISLMDQEPILDSFFVYNIESLVVFQMTHFTLCTILYLRLSAGVSNSKLGWGSDQWKCPIACAEFVKP